jgi:hypothetical protein
MEIRKIWRLCIHKNLMAIVIIIVCLVVWNILGIELNIKIILAIRVIYRILIIISKI